MAKNKNNIINIEEIGEITGINNIPITTPTILRKLKENGYTELGHLVDAEPSDLTEITDLTLQEAKENIEFARKHASIDNLYKEPDKNNEHPRIKLNLKEYDEKTEGEHKGIKSDGITGIISKIPRDRSILCHNILVNFLKQHKTAEVIYVDSKKNFDQTMLKTLCKEKNLSYNDVRSKTKYIPAHTLTKFNIVIDRLDTAVKDKPLLIIFDDFTSIISQEALLSPRGKQSVSNTNNALYRLNKLYKRKQEIYIVVTTGITTKQDDSPLGYVPYGGTTLMKGLTNNIYIKNHKDPTGKRILHLTPSDHENDLTNSQVIVHMKRTGEITPGESI